MTVCFFSLSHFNSNELKYQMELCELHKSASEDVQAKSEELTKATEELQRLLRDASERFRELETQSKAQNDYLMKELERANTLLDSNRSRLLREESNQIMSPSAAAASR